MASLPATASLIVSRCASMGTSAISQISNSNAGKKLAGLKTQPGAIGFAKHHGRKKVRKGTFCNGGSDGPDLNDVMTELKQLNERLSDKLSETETAISNKVEVEVKTLRDMVVKSLRDVVKSLEDHTGRTAESRLRHKRTTQEMWRAGSGKAAQRSFYSVEDIEHAVACPKGADKRQLLDA